MTGTYLAPAKINLGLEVLFKRPDGYHELNTLFCRVEEPHDAITISPSGSFLLTSSEPSLATDKTNVAYRAAEAFCRKIGEPLPRLHFHLSKSIPMGAGLGGGSSDAATVLTILNDWYRSSGQEALTQGELIELSAPLGADIPFFLMGTRLAEAGGIGEILHPVKAKLDVTVLIVYDPAIHVSTKAAYDSLVPEPRPRGVEYERFFEANYPVSRWKEFLRNDFEPEIFRQFPKLAHLKHSLYAHGAQFALMSGSGSALFGLFDTPEKAQQAKGIFEDQGMNVFIS